MKKSIRKTPKLKTIIEISKFKDKRYLNIRDWYERSDGQYAPTQKGVAIPLSLAKNLPGLIQEVLDSKRHKVKKHSEE